MNTDCEYLDRSYDWQAQPLTDAYDELPLWSAAPGLLLLDHVPLASVRALLDIGCGTGFPLLLLARRLGPAAEVHGLDPWAAALHRVAQKCAAWGLRNVTLHQADATNMPLPDQSMDCITANLGLLNFAAPAAVLAECRRVLRPGGKLCITSNLRGTFAEFYHEFVAAAPAEAQVRITAHIDHRPTVEGLQAQLETAGWRVRQVVQGSHRMRYANGSAFLRDYFIGMGFLPGWRACLSLETERATFAETERLMNARAHQEGEFAVTVPLAYVEAEWAGE